ncbi:MAG: DoxX family protein [Candidatus Marinimicrobia bacterium]|nr:DoxX family protein [Candidatus Neomarinimicrobiota bacterium]MCF7902793.1 DoxX family protein [Candidatus Neomarinimicrobiota bacterium]
MSIFDRFAPHAHWLVRLSLAATFIYHGIPKFTHPGMIGMPIIIVILVGLAEVGGAILLLWGGVGPDWATRVASAFFAIVMLGAIMMIHMAYGWNSINMGTGNEGKGMEFQVLILAISLYFLLKGNGTRTDNTLSG